MEMSVYEHVVCKLSEHQYQVVIQGFSSWFELPFDSLVSSELGSPVCVCVFVCLTVLCVRLWAAHILSCTRLCVCMMNGAW